jgi:hypothetical protein
MKYEADDPARIEDMTRGRAYGLVKAFLEVSLARARGELEQPLEVEATATLRGEIKALRTALDAPNSVIREVKEAAKRGKVSGPE